MIEWLVSNWDTILMVVSALLTVASVVTRLTATPKDDEIVLKLIGLLSILKPGEQARAGHGALKAPGAPVKPMPESKVVLVRENTR